MSSYYSSAPSSPATSFFPTGTASPHSFSSFHSQSPREQHQMYADFGAACQVGRTSNAQGGQSQGSLSKAFQKIARTTRSYFSVRGPSAKEF